MVFDDLVLHHAHTGFLYCHLCQRDSGFVGSHCGSKKDFIHLLLCIGGKYLLCLAHLFHARLQSIHIINDHLCIFGCHLVHPPLVSLVCISLLIVILLTLFF